MKCRFVHLAGQVESGISSFVRSHECELLLVIPNLVVPNRCLSSYCVIFQRYPVGRRKWLASPEPVEERPRVLDCAQILQVDVSSFDAHRRGVLQPCLFSRCSLRVVDAQERTDSAEGNTEQGEDSWPKRVPIHDPHCHRSRSWRKQVRSRRDKRPPAHWLHIGLLPRSACPLTRHLRGSSDRGSSLSVPPEDSAGVDISKLRATVT